MNAENNTMEEEKLIKISSSKIIWTENTNSSSILFLEWKSIVQKWFLEVKWNKIMEFRIGIK